MKKILFAIAAVAMIMATSCKKESVNPAVDAPEGAFVCTIDNGAVQNIIASGIKDDMGTMTTIPDGRNVFWKVNDGISINGITYTATTVSQGQATFTTTSATEPTSPYYAFYGDNLESFNADGATLKSTFTYDNDNNAANLPMYATGSGKTLTFSNICAVLEIKIPAACDKIVLNANENIAGPFTVNAQNTAVLTNSGIGLSNTTTVTGTFTVDQLVYVAIPAGTYNSFQITLYNGTSPINNPTAKTVTFAVNKIYPVIIKVPALLSGVFSVSSTKQVQFTTGNLYYDGSSFHLEPNQAAYPTSWSASHVGHFYFASSAAAAYSTSAPSEITTLFCNEGNKIQVDGESGLYVLSDDEWMELIITHNRYDGGNYWLIAPDNYSGPDLSNITTASAATAAGVLYLPLAYYRDGTTVSNAKNGYMTSSSPDEDFYYYMTKNGDDLDVKSIYRDKAFPIRLVKTYTGN